MTAKQAAAAKAVEYVQDGMIVGLGTGSTAYWAIERIGERVRQGLSIRAIASSLQSQNQAKELAIPIIGFEETDSIDVTIDGADEVDGSRNLIKGGGGALLREKIIASASKIFIVVVDESKIVQTLGTFPLPVEVIPFGWQLTVKMLGAQGCQTSVRSVNGKFTVTDNGNYLVDCRFGAIPNPAALQQKINLIPGVVENGLFVGMAHRVIVGYNDGSTREI